MILHPFQHYFSHIRMMGRMIVKGRVQWNLFTVEKFLSRAGLRPGTARSVDQGLIH